MNSREAAKGPMTYNDKYILKTASFFSLNEKRSVTMIREEVKKYGIVNK